MPFDNFYKDSFYDKVVHRWAFFVLLVVGAFIVFLLIPAEPKPKVVTDSERIKNIEALCQQLPKPEGISFWEKREPFKNGSSVSVDYDFHTNRSEAEIYPIYVIWLNDNGWIDDKLSYKPVSFSKNKQTISIRSNPFIESSIFVVTCAEKE